MTSNFMPLIDVLRDLRAQLKSNASGFFFITTEENHSCIIRLNNGDIEKINFRLHNNDAAVERLAMVTQARARFEPGRPNPVSKSAPISNDSKQWLLGGFERQLSSGNTGVAAPPASDTGGSKTSLDPALREKVENIALHYLGPIASILCDEAFEKATSLREAIDILSTNLPQQEANEFVKAAHAEFK